MVSRPVLIPFVPLALTLASLMWPGHAAAQVSRCVGSDGRITYTDQRCRDIGARPISGQIVIIRAEIDRPTLAVGIEHE